MQGNATDAESEEVGLTLGRRYFDIFFDAAAFSDACMQRISSKIFAKYDEATSQRLVSFFWNDEFLNRFYEASKARSTSLACDVSCFLALERRPLPSMAMHDLVFRDRDNLRAPNNVFLLARTLISRQSIGPDQLSSLVSAADSLTEGTIKFLYLLASADYIQSVFRQEVDPPQICIREKCVAVAPVTDIANCQKFYEEAAVVDSLDRGVALKFWMMKSSQDVAQQCVRSSLRGSPAAEMRTGVASAIQLFVFNPELQVNDLVNNFARGVFREFDFINEDISRLSNLDLSRLGGVSLSFARWILDQLESDPTAVSLINASDTLRTLLWAAPQSRARLELLLCRRPAVLGRPDCDRGDIYLRAMSQSRL
jgi:hypothetical protein